MSKQFIWVDVPEGKELDLFQIRHCFKEIKPDFSCRAVRDEWVARNYPLDPIVSATTYAPGSIEPGMEIVETGWRTDPHRPVLMRGGRARLIAIHANGNYCANNWAMTIVDRYVRAKKFTSFNNIEIGDYLRKLVSNLNGKYGLSYHVWRGLSERGIIYINGHEYYEREFRPQQLANLKAMHQLQVKIDRIEGRAEKYKRKTERQDHRRKEFRVAA